MAALWLKYRFLLLCSLLFALMAFSISRQYWVGDFWEHSAVINELAFNPLHPQHSILSSEAPNPLYSPYALFWGLFARLVNIGPIKALSIAGVVNLLLVLIGLYAFISALWPKGRVGIAYYSLLLMLFWWGALVWNFSGFLHLRGLGYILPYPSTFNLGLALIVLAINHRRIEKGQAGLWAPIYLLSLVVLLSHQFTFIFLAAGVLAMGICKKGSLRSELVQIGAYFALLLLAAAAWPYYPFFKLIFGGASVYDANQKSMYEYLWIRLWPALLGLPLLILDLRANWRQPLLLMFGMLGFIYLAGYLLGAYSYGRALSFMVLIVDFTIARYLYRLEQEPPLRRLRFPGWPLLFSASFSVLLLAAAYLPFIAPALERSIFSQTKTYEPLFFLKNTTQHYDVLMADPNSSKSIELVSFSGKLVGAFKDLPFVPDLDERNADSVRFFAEQTTAGERQEIIRKYGVQYILLENVQSEKGKHMAAAMKAVGEIVYRNNRYLLFAVGR